MQLNSLIERVLKERLQGLTTTLQRGTIERIEGLSGIMPMKGQGLRLPGVVQGGIMTAALYFVLQVKVGLTVS